MVTIVTETKICELESDKEDSVAKCNGMIEEKDVWSKLLLWLLSNYTCE